VLGGYQDVVNSDWLENTLSLLLIFNDNLRFAVRPQPWDLTVLSFDCHDLANRVCKHVRVWMKSFSVPFVGCITEHKSLITSTHVELVLLLVNSSGDVGILSVHVDDNVALISVESNVLTNESDLSADSSGNLFEVNLRLVNAYFSEKNNLNIENF